MKKINIVQPRIGKWSKKEQEFLINFYPQKGLKFCAGELNRTPGAIRSQASSLKLKQNRNSKFFKDWQNKAKESKVGKKRPVHSKIMKQKGVEGKLWQQNKEYWTDDKRKGLSERSKENIKKNGHPKGMMGKKQTAKCKIAVSKSSKKMWSDKTSLVNSNEYRQTLSDRMSKNIQERLKNKGTVYSRSKNGWYTINKKNFYFRSGWEVNYARYLEHLQLDGKIVSWEFEPDTFWFEKIKRGVRSYLPDFKVFNLDGSFEYHEVKGWMDAKSATKIKRLAKYYPDVKLVVIGKKEYNALIKFENLWPVSKKIEKQ